MENYDPIQVELRTQINLPQQVTCETRKKFRISVS